MLEVIAEKQSAGWDVAFVDGSKDCRRGVGYAGFGVWFGENNVKTNAHKCVWVSDSQSHRRSSTELLE